MRIFDYRICSVVFAIALAGSLGACHSKTDSAPPSTQSLGAPVSSNVVEVSQSNFTQTSAQYFSAIQSYAAANPNPPSGYDPSNAMVAYRSDSQADTSALSDVPEVGGTARMVDPCPQGSFDFSKVDPKLYPGFSAPPSECAATPTPTPVASSTPSASPTPTAAPSATPAASPTVSATSLTVKEQAGRGRGGRIRGIPPWWRRFFNFGNGGNGGGGGNGNGGGGFLGGGAFFGGCPFFAPFPVVQFGILGCSTGLPATECLLQTTLGRTCGATLANGWVAVCPPGGDNGLPGETDTGWFCL